MQMNNMKTLIKTLTCLGALAFALTACGSGGTAIAPTSQANLSANTLQFAVGTANLYGATTGLNVVATYRQPNGNSGTLLNTPTITLPHAIPAGLSAGAAASGWDVTSSAPSGPAPGEINITSTAQNAGVSCTTLTSFGQSGGVYGLGIEPFNAKGQADCTLIGTNVTGTPFQVAPYAVPLYDSASPTFTGTADPNAFEPWGGPPAFLLTGSTVSVVGSSNYPSGTAGVSEGIDVFAGIAPVASGAYSLSVSVPANTGSTTQTTPFTMPAAPMLLGLATSPAYVPDAAADGGGTFAFVMPTSATEAYLQVTDYGPAAAKAVSCNGSSATTPVYYTIEAGASGTLTLPPLLGPNATPSVCTAALNALVAANAGTGAVDDQIAIQVVAFDYDLFHASYPSSLGSAAPVILGTHGSDDITISAATCQVSGGSCTASLPLLKSRAFASANSRR